LATADDTTAEPPSIHITTTKLGFFHSQTRAAVEPVILEYLQRTIWAGGPHDELKAVRVSDILRLNDAPQALFLLLIDADYVDGSSRTFFWPAAVISGERYSQLKHPAAAAMRLSGGIEGLVVDAMYVLKCAGNARLMEGASMSLLSADIVGTQLVADDGQSVMESTTVTSATARIRPARSISASACWATAVEPASTRWQTRHYLTSQGLYMWRRW
jgi:hypothetical protein